MSEREPLVVEEGQDPQYFIYIYKFDQWGKYTGQQWYYLYDPYPGNYNTVEPPEVPPGQFLYGYAGGWVLVDVEPGPPKPTPQQIKAQFQLALTQFMDDAAKRYGYGEDSSPLGMSLLSAVSYKGDPDEQFNAEGTAFFNWRSAVWVYAREQQALIIAGERELPTVSQLLSELPELVI